MPASGPTSCSRCGGAGAPGGCPGCGLPALDDAAGRYPELAPDAIRARLARARRVLASAHAGVAVAAMLAVLCVGLGLWRVLPLVIAAMLAGGTGILIGRRSCRDLAAMLPEPEPHGDGAGRADG